jgi:hypothetical protein
MKNCKDGMTVYHTGTCKTHDFFYAFSHRGFVAVHPAIGTGCLPCLKGTFIKTFIRIIKKLSAFIAKPVAGFVTLVTKDIDHGCDSILFSDHPASFYHFA